MSATHDRMMLESLVRRYGKDQVEKFLKENDNEEGPASYTDEGEDDVTPEKIAEDYSIVKTDYTDEIEELLHSIEKDISETLTGMLGPGLEGRGRLLWYIKIDDADAPRLVVAGSDYGKTATQIPICAVTANNNKLYVVQGNGQGGTEKVEFNTEDLAYNWLYVLTKLSDVIGEGSFDIIYM